VTGARKALVLAMYHPAAALRSPAVERESYEDAATIPAVLLDARARRADDVRGASVAAVTARPASAVAVGPSAPPSVPAPAPASSAADPEPSLAPVQDGATDDADQMTLF